MTVHSCDFVTFYGFYDKDERGLSKSKQELPNWVPFGKGFPSHLII